MSGCARLAGHKHNKSIFLVVLAGVEIARGTINLFYPAPGSPPRHGVPVLLLFFFPLFLLVALRCAWCSDGFYSLKHTDSYTSKVFNWLRHTDILLAKIPAEA